MCRILHWGDIINSIPPLFFCAPKTPSGRLDVKANRSYVSPTLSAIDRLVREPSGVIIAARPEQAGLPVALMVIGRRVAAVATDTAGMTARSASPAAPSLASSMRTSSGNHACTRHDGSDSKLIRRTHLVLSCGWIAARFELKTRESLSVRYSPRQVTPRAVPGRSAALRLLTDYPADDELAKRMEAR
jgi:hypothetical protein